MENNFLAKRNPSSLLRTTKEAHDKLPKITIGHYKDFNINNKRKLISDQIAALKIANPSNINLGERYNKK